jgi:tape measure domain-containing protein
VNIVKLFELYGDIKLKNDGVENKLDKIDKKAKITGKEFDTLGSKATKLKGMLSNAFSFAFGGVILKGFDKILDSFKSGINAGIEFNSTMEQNKIAFESMLGSADKSKKLLDQLSKMAANTPFEFPELTQTAKKMLAFGFEAEKIPDMLTKIGDAAAGLGMGADGVDRLTLAIGQMRAKGKIAGGEMMQLTEAGVPAWDILAQAMGKSTQEVMKLSEKGLIPADKAITMLVDGMEKRFPNMMSKQSKSFKGLMSTLKDNVQMTFGKILEPAFNNMTNHILPGLIDKVGEFSKSIQNGQNPIQALQSLIESKFGVVVGETFRKLTNTVKNLKDGVLQFKPVITDVFSYLLNNVIPKLVTFADQNAPKIKQIFADTKDVLQRIMPVLKTLNDFLLSEAMRNLGYTVDVVQTLTSSLDDLLNFRFGSLIDNFKKLLTPIERLVSLANTIKSPAGAIGSFFGGSLFKQDGNPIRPEGSGLGPGYATGTENATKGWHWVGEKGAELMYFNGGEKVVNHEDSIKTISNNQPLQLFLILDGKTLGDVMIPHIDKASGTQIKLTARGVGVR